MKNTLKIGLVFTVMLLVDSVVGQDETLVQISVVNSQDQPLKGVEAFWFHEGKAAKLDQKGNAFQVQPIGLIVVHKTGYQYSGLILKHVEKERAKLTMLGNDQPAQPKKTLPSPLSKELRTQLVDDLNAKSWSKLEGKTDMRAQFQALQFLTKSDPFRVVDYLEKNKASLPPQAMSMRVELVKTLAKSDLDLAIELSDSVEQPMFRTAMLAALVKHATEDSLRDALEEQWLDAIHSVPQPQLRLAMLASLAEHYQNTERANLVGPILEKALPDVAKLPAGGWSGYPRSLFAGLLVGDDPGEALQLIEGIDKKEKNRALARVAYHAGRSNPALAIELLNKLEFDENTITRASYHHRITYRIAEEQTEAAIEIAKSIDEPNQRAWCLATIAMRLAASDKPKASQLIREAVEVLDRIDLKQPARFLRPAETLGGILSVVEQVNPESIESRLWQMVWMMVPRTRWTQDYSQPDFRYQTTAAMIARYDRELALAIVGNRELVVGSDPVRATMNAVALRGDHLLEVLEGFEKGDRVFSSSFRPQEMLARTLQADPEGFWKSISKPSFLNWPIETFEDY